MTPNPYLLHIYYTLCSPTTSCVLSKSSIPCRLPIFRSSNHINSTRNHITSSRNHSITRQATVLALTYLGPSDYGDIHCTEITSIILFKLRPSLYLLEQQTRYLPYHNQRLINKTTSLSSINILNTKSDPDDQNIIHVIIAIVIEARKINVFIFTINYAHNSL